MKKILVASKNPVKLKAALSGFQAMFPQEHFETEGISVPSGVSEQPMTDAQTLQGALTRVSNARGQRDDFDYYVGIEGGIDEIHEEMEAFAWIVVQDKEGKKGKGRTGTFFLPPKVSELIHQGHELGDADDIVFGRSNSKQDTGSVGILTDDLITRTSYYHMAVVLALIPFKKRDLY